MKKRATFTLDADVINRLRRIPRGFSVSSYVNDMLKEMLRELKVARSPEEFEELEGTPPLSVEEAIVRAWGQEEDLIRERLTTAGRVKTKGKSKKR